MINVGNDMFAVPQGAKELRKGTRYKALWRIAAIVVGQELHDGRVKDISPHGAAILIARNLNPQISVSLNIYIPPLVGPGAPKILIVHGMTSHAIHERCSNGLQL